MTHDSQGWKDTKFLLGNTLIGTGADERVNLTPEAGRVAGAIKYFNSFEKWSSLSDTLFAQGQEARGLALLSTFAAPLLPLLGEGGIAICLVTEQKHQVEMLFSGIQSAWGRQQGLHISRALAFPKKFEILKACGALPCVFPDLFVTDPSVVSQFIEAALAQNTVLVSASPKYLNRDISFRDLNPQAEERRVLEIPLPLSTPQADAELTSVYHNNFGHAGKKFIRYITYNHTFIKQHLAEYQKSVAQKLGDRKNERLVLNFLACVGMAARICDKLGIVHVTPSRMIECAEGILQGLRAKDFEARHLPELTLRDYLMARLDGILVMQGDAVGKGRDKLLYDGAAPTEVRYEILLDNLVFSRAGFRLWCQGRHVPGDKILHQLKALGVAKGISTMRNLRANHPHNNFRGNVRSTVVEVNAKHPLIAEHILSLEMALEIRRGPKGIYRIGGIYRAEPASQSPPPDASAPPEADPDDHPPAS